ncbi:MAG: ABC transporter permease, partial [Gemmatimonadota bacterium]
MTLDRWPSILALRLRSLFHRHDVERELDEELQYHIEAQTAEYIRSGMSPAAARTAALRALGGIEYQKEQARDTRGTRPLEEMWSDLIVAVRRLRRAPGFALAVILTLALGIGANTAMFTMLRGTLLRPLPNRHGEQLVYLRQTAAANGDEGVNFSIPEVAEYRATSKSLSAIAEYSSVIPFTLVGGDGVPVRLRAAVVSGNYFEVMGLEPVLGRLTTDQDDGPAAPSVTVLSHQYWMQHFGADSSVIGRSVRLNDQSSTIVGVVQDAPHYPRRSDIFVNTVASPHHLSATMVTDRSHRMTELFGRLAPGATVEQARDELTRIASSMYLDHPEAYAKAAHYAVSLKTLRDALNERAALTFWMLMGAATFVLLIACANVANLTLMRGVGREREMVVRSTLGAGAGRLRRLLLAENLVLALVGGALGVFVAFAGLRLLVSFAAQLSTRANEIRVDGVVLALGVATSLVVAVVLSFVPRVGGDRGLSASLAAAGRRSTLGRAGQRVQRSLVVLQLAVSMMLLTGAGLLVRTLTNLQAVPIGMDAEQVLTLELPLEGAFEALAMKQPENLAHFERLRDGVQALPGVDVASIATTAPLRGTMVDFDVKAEGRPLSPNEPQPHAALKTV